MYGVGNLLYHLPSICHYKQIGCTIQLTIYHRLLTERRGSEKLSLLEHITKYIDKMFMMACLIGDVHLVSHDGVCTKCSASLQVNR